MLKTCSRCGIVPQNHICPYKKNKYKNKNDEADKFRKSKQWTNKSIEIRQRDKYLCQVCIRNLYNTVSKYNFNKLEVHHITPINEDYTKRLDNENLITLCNYHHKLADSDGIPRELLQNIVLNLGIPPTIDKKN